MSEECPMPDLYYAGRVHGSPDVVLGAGPERVAEEKPPKGWKASPLLGFGTKGDEG